MSVSCPLQGSSGSQSEALGEQDLLVASADSTGILEVRRGPPQGEHLGQRVLELGRSALCGPSTHKSESLSPVLGTSAPPSTGAPAPERVLPASHTSHSLWVSLVVNAANVVGLGQAGVLLIFSRTFSDPPYLGWCWEPEEDLTQPSPGGAPQSVVMESWVISCGSVPDGIPL